jgi:hypothetical protein
VDQRDVFIAYARWNDQVQPSLGMAHDVDEDKEITPCLGA